MSDRSVLQQVEWGQQAPSVEAEPRPTQMLSAAQSGLGPGLLQRKLAQRRGKDRSGSKTIHGRVDEYSIEGDKTKLGINRGRNHGVTSDSSVQVEGYKEHHSISELNANGLYILVPYPIIEMKERPVEITIPVDAGSVKQ